MTADFHVDEIAVYFARALGLAQLSLALLVVALSGVVPLGSPVDSPSSSPATAPYASAAVFLSTMYHASAAFYSYGCYYYQFYDTIAAYAVGCAGSTVLAALGLWCLLFGGNNSGHFSRRTGADKRTSGFPFTNQAAYKKSKAK